MIVPFNYSFIYTKRWTMQTLFIATTATLLNFTFNIAAHLDLFVIMFIVIGLDFVTGVIKAARLNEARTSQGYRRTVNKFIQYGSAVCVSFLLLFLMQNVDPVVAAHYNIVKYSRWLGDFLLMFIIFIEITSILENVYVIDNKTQFAKYFIKPLLRLLTFQITREHTKDEPEK